MRNTVTGALDEPMALAGSAVLLLAGLWFALLVPYVMNRNKAKIAANIAAVSESEPLR